MKRRYFGLLLDILFGALKMWIFERPYLKALSSKAFSVFLPQMLSGCSFAPNGPGINVSVKISPKSIVETHNQSLLTVRAERALSSTCGLWNYVWNVDVMRDSCQLYAFTKESLRLANMRWSTLNRAGQIALNTVGRNNQFLMAINFIETTRIILSIDQKQEKA